MSTTTEAEPLLLPAEAQFDSLPLIQAFIDADITGCSVLEGDLRDAPDRIYLTPDQADEKTGEFPRVERIALLPEGLKLGAGDSHHGVAFGEVLIEEDGSERQVGVAIKAFDTDSGQARHEFDSLLAARRLGFDTFEPLALAKHGVDTFLITRRRRDINSLDNIAWDISPHDTERYQNQVLPALKLMTTYLARIHGNGFFHGDAQAKNFAVTDTGTSLISDLEDTLITGDSQQIIDYINGGYGDPTESLVYRDLTHCWYALIHPVNKAPNLFLENEPYEVCMEVFERDFLNPYFESLVRSVHPSILDKLDLLTLRQAIFDYVAQTT